MSDSSTNVWLSTAQVAKRLGCHRNYVVRLIQGGQLDAERAGEKYYRVREDVLAAYQAGRTQAPSKAASGPAAPEVNR